MRCKTVRMVIACGGAEDKKEEALQEHLQKCDRCRAFAGRYGKMKDAVQGIGHPVPSEALVLRSLALCNADPVRIRSPYRPLVRVLKAVLFLVLGVFALITLLWTIPVISGISYGEPMTVEQMTALAYVFQNIVMVLLIPVLLRRRRRALILLRIRSSDETRMALML